MIQVLRDVTPCRWVSCSHRVDQSTSGFGGLDYITVEHEGITNGNHGEAAIGTLSVDVFGCIRLEFRRTVEPHRPNPDALVALDL